MRYAANVVFRFLSNVCRCGSKAEALAAVGCLEHRSIIAVIIFGPISCIVCRAAEGAAVAAIRSGYVDVCRRKEAVSESGISHGITSKFSPTDEAAPVGCICSFQFTRKGAAIKIDIPAIGVEDADETAVGAVTFPVAVDAYAADAVLDVIVVTLGFNRNAAVVLCRAVDAAVNDEVLDGGIIDEIERGTFLVEIAFRTAKGECQRIAAAVEDATEGMVVGAHPLVDGNVSIQL